MLVNLVGKVGKFGWLFVNLVGKFVNWVGGLVNLVGDMPIYA